MKYRVWHKIDKKFYIYSDSNTRKWVIDTNGNLCCIELLDEKWELISLISKDFYDINPFVIKEHPTDKGANEIYEGDYVSIYPFSNEIYEVKWFENMWVLEDRTDNSGRIERLYDNYGNQRLFNLIGNKYEKTIIQN